MSDTDHPQLTAMGITKPMMIDRYHVNGTIDSDYLRIVYERGEGTFFPVARTFRFPKVQRNTATGSVMESNPELKKATAELKTLLAAKESREGLAEAVLEELALLQREVAARTAYIKDLVEKL